MNIGLLITCIFIYLMLGLGVAISWYSPSEWDLPRVKFKFAGLFILYPLVLICCVLKGFYFLMQDIWC